MLTQTDINLLETLITRVVDKRTENQNNALKSIIRFEIASELKTVKSSQKSLSDEIVILQKRLAAFEATTSIRLDAIELKIETVHDRLNQKIDTVRESLNKKIDTVQESLNQKIEIVQDNLNKKIDMVYQSLNEKIDMNHKDVKNAFEAQHDTIDSLHNTLVSRVNRIEKHCRLA